MLGAAKAGDNRRPSQMAKAADPATADKALDALEKCSNKVEKAQGKAVLLKGAEDGYLSEVGNMRDMLKEAPSAGDDKDRSKMMAVFGGDCYRIAKIRFILEKTQLGELRAADKRIPECLAAVETIEAVIKEKGFGKNLQAALDALRDGKEPPRAAAVDAEMDGTWFNQKGDEVVVKNGETTINGEKVVMKDDGAGGVQMTDPGGGKKKKAGKVLGGKKEIVWDDGEKWCRERAADPRVEGNWYMPDGSVMEVKNGKATVDGQPCDVKADKDGNMTVTDPAGKTKKKGKLSPGDKGVAWDDGTEWSRDKPTVDPALEGTWFLPDGTKVEVKDGKAKLPDGKEVKLAGPGSSPKGPGGSVNMYDPAKPGADPMKKGAVGDGGNKLDFGDGKPWTRVTPPDPKLEGKWFLPDGSEIDVKDGKATLGGKPIHVKRAPDGKVLVTDDKGSPIKKQPGNLKDGDKALDFGDGSPWAREKPKSNPKIDGTWYLPDNTPVVVKDGVATIDGKPFKLAPVAGDPNAINVFDPSKPGGDPDKKGGLKDNGDTLDLGDGKPWSRNKTKKGGKFDDPFECVARDIMVELGMKISPELDWGKQDGTFKLKFPAEGIATFKSTCKPELPKHKDLKEYPNPYEKLLAEFKGIEVLMDPSSPDYGPNGSEGIFTKEVSCEVELMEIPEDIEAKVGSRVLQPWGQKKLKEGNDITEVHYEVEIEEQFELNEKNDDINILSMTLTYKFVAKLTGVGSAKFKKDGKPRDPPPPRK